jgi:formyltetrahydrofolate hydrolase
MSTVTNCDIPFQGRRGAHQRVMLLVCKSGHALVDILDRWRIGEPEMIPASTRTLPCPVQP